jgi:putative ABC transport system permease protein
LSHFKNWEGVMDSLLQDLRYCLRTLKKSPSFTFVAILTLALGIGANTAIFSIVNAILLNPFPYKNQDRLVMLRYSMPKRGVQESYRSSGPEIVDLRDTRSFESLTAFESVSRNLTSEQEPERIQALKISAEFFPLLGVQPVLGRTIQPEDQRVEAERVLVISYGLWQRRFGGEPSVIGKKVTLDDEPYKIVGVMPNGFGYESAEGWFPIPAKLENLNRQARPFLVMCRLKPGVSILQANAELETISRRREQELAASIPEYEGRSMTLIPLLDFFIGTTKQALYILLCSVGMVLLIACANIANLLFARSVSREREIAIRSALGANRIRIISQILTESFVLALVGGILGLLLALWGVDTIVTFIPPNAIPAGTNISVNSTVLLFTLALSMVTALLFGLWPAIQSSKINMNESLKEGGQKSSAGHRSRRMQSALVVSEIALSLLLLIMAGLMIRSFSRLIDIDPGFNPENVLSMRLNLSPTKYKGGQQNAAFFEQLIERVEKLPGITSVAVASHMPFIYTENWTFTIEGNASQDPSITQNLDTRTISPGYFQVMSIPLIKGDNFTPQERADSPHVVIINQTMAKRFWPNEDPVGKRIKLEKTELKDPWFTIKGVVEDSAQDRLDVPISPEVYFHLSQMASRYRRMNLAIKSDVNPMGLVASIEKEVRGIDKDQPVYQIQTMEELVSISIAARRLAMLLLLLFAGVALLLAAVGIYGVISYTVTQRTHEIGIRVALGAQRRDVLKLIVRQGMALIFLGLAFGLAGAFMATRLMSSLLFGISATDPFTFFSVTLILSAIALFSCYIPARRATKVDPIIALRYE